MERSREIYPGLGIVHYVSFPKLLRGEGPILEALELVLADSFFNTVEISWIKNEGLKQSACDMLKCSGKRIVFSGGPPYAYQGINLSSLEIGERTHSLELAKKLVDDALLFGACIHLITGGPDTDPVRRDYAKEVLVESILRLLDYIEIHAKESPLILSLEPVDQTVHRKGLIGPIAEAVEVTRKVHASGGNLILTIDQSHLAQLGVSPTEALTQSNEFMYHVHVANCVIADPKNPLYGDEHPRFGIPGGVHDLAELVDFLKILQGLGFFLREPPYGGLPIVSMEVKPWDDEDPLVVLEESKEFLAKAFSEVNVLSIPL